MGIKEWALEQIESFGRGYVKGQIRVRAGEYLQALEEGGMGYEELRYLVEHDISFYQDFMPPSWKEALFMLVGGEIEKGRSNLEELKSLTEDDMGEFLPLFMEAIAEDFPWFVQAVSVDKKSWIVKEVSLFLKDLEAKKETPW